MPSAKRSPVLSDHILIPVKRVFSQAAVAPPHRKSSLKVLILTPSNHFRSSYVTSSIPCSSIYFFVSSLQSISASIALGTVRLDFLRI